MIVQEITKTAAEAIRELYGHDIGQYELPLQKTRSEFGGDFTLVVFTFSKISKKGPEETGREIGQKMLDQRPDLIAGFNVIKGFLNLVILKKCWLDFLNSASADANFGFHPPRQGAPLLIEFSSPNTNKPLHLGHIRNNLLGWSLSKILEANGHQVIKTNLVNDRGIHICKSMLAWKKWGNGETPETAGEKGDHFVGKYYVIFDQHYRKEMSGLIAGGMSEDEALREAPLIREAQLMLRLWEEGDQEIRKLWATMNGWVYAGFDETYRRLGISFDKVYYESETYLLGKELVKKGLEDNKLSQRNDNSVWIDLRDEGMDEKLLLRADGTSVYITQDLGTARLRHEEFRPEKMIYVVGNEQDYHFAVLKKVLKKLGFDWADAVFHLSYGMVELPEGKMKSREGTVGDADDLLDEMYAEARRMTETLGKTGNLDKSGADSLFTMIGKGALKYFILKVDPRKNMLFNPEESIDFNGNTGPFIQYTHARICSLLGRGSGVDHQKPINAEVALLNEEREIIRLCYGFPEVVRQAGDEYSPAHIANYIFDLAQAYNTFYQKVPVLKEENEDAVRLRLKLSQLTGSIIKKAMSLLGIDVPEKM